MRNPRLKPLHQRWTYARMIARSERLLRRANPVVVSADTTAPADTTMWTRIYNTYRRLSL